MIGRMYEAATEWHHVASNGVMVMAMGKQHREIENKEDARGHFNCRWAKRFGLSSGVEKQSSRGRSRNASVLDPGPN